MKIKEKEYNAITGEETITERDETTAEKKAREAFIAKLAADETEATAKATAKATLLTKLGITAEEAQLLLS
jgi:hypothetical protein